MKGEKGARVEWNGMEWNVRSSTKEVNRSGMVLKWKREKRDERRKEKKLITHTQSAVLSVSRGKSHHDGQ